MSENRRSVQRRIRSVKSTQQITSAMKLVAAAKLRRAQARALAAKPYAQVIANTLGLLVRSGAGQNDPLLAPRATVEQRAGRPTAYVVIAADRGLAGAYNIAVLDRAEENMQSRRETVLVTIGRKGRDYFRRRGRTPDMEFGGLGDEPQHPAVSRIVDQIVKLYADGTVDEVRLVYTEFTSTSVQRPRIMQLLPVVAPPDPGAATEYILVPDATALVGSLAARYVQSVFYDAILEAKAAEQAARVAAMGNATDNATGLIANLTLAMNRVRQGGITREISEIMGGAGALDE